MILYNDGFMVISADPETGEACWADKLMGYDILSVSLAQFLANKCKENWVHGYSLIDKLSKIRRGKR